MNQSWSENDVHLDSYLMTRRIYDGDRYLAGYAVIEKHKCEIHNFISPTFRILRFQRGVSDWLIDGTLLRFGPGDMVILSNVNKRNIHQVLDESIAYEMIDFYPRVLSKNYMVNAFFADEHLVSGPSDPGRSTVNAYFDRIREEILSEDSIPGRNESIRMLLNLMAVECCRRLGGEDTGRGSMMFPISESVQYITEHISGNLSVEDVAAHLGYSVEHYSRQFKRWFGISPVQYIINTRIENTLYYVREEHMTIREAAARSGFRSSSAFYKSFRKYKGTAPNAYIADK